jgi:hypothetical protein
MCTGHDDVVGPDAVARLSRRGFLRTAVTTAAVVAFVELGQVPLEGIAHPVPLLEALPSGNV